MRKSLPTMPGEAITQLRLIGQTGSQPEAAVPREHITDPQRVFRVRNLALQLLLTPACLISDQRAVKMALNAARGSLGALSTRSTALLVCDVQASQLGAR
jgi:hypothetical protein